MRLNWSCMVLCPSLPHIQIWNDTNRNRRRVALLGMSSTYFVFCFVRRFCKGGNVRMLGISLNFEPVELNLSCLAAAQLTYLAWLFVMLCLLAWVYSLVLRHLLSCMMWRKRSGFGCCRVFYQLFPILSLSLNPQGVMRVSALYERGVCAPIVF